MLELVGGNRLAEEVALIGCTPLHAEKGELISRFHSFGHDVEIEGTPHPNDCPHDRRIALPELQILNEGSIDFQRIDREALKVGEGGVSSPEVIDRHSKPRFLESFQRGRRCRRVRHENTFGQLQLDVLRCASFGIDERLDLIGDIALPEMKAGQVD